MIPITIGRRRRDETTNRTQRTPSLGLLLLVLLCTAIGLVTSVPASAEDEPSTGSLLVQRFNRLQLRGVRDTAETYAELDALEAEATDQPRLRLDLHRFRADCYRRSGRIDQAETAYLEIIAHSRDDEFSRLNAMRSLAEVAWVRGDPAEAERRYARLLERVRHVRAAGGDPFARHPERRWLLVAARQHRAALLGQLGRTSEAIEAYEGALEENTPPVVGVADRGFSNAAVHVNLAALWRSVGDTERVVRAFQNARLADPDHMPAYVEHQLLDELRPERGKPERLRRMEEIRQRWSQDPWAIVVTSELAYELDEIGRSEEADALLHELGRRQPRGETPYGDLIRDSEVDARIRLLTRAMSERRLLDAEQLTGALMRSYPEHPRLNGYVQDVVAEIARMKRIGAIGPGAEGALPTADVRSVEQGVDTQSSTPWTLLLIANTILAAALLAGFGLRRAARRAPGGGVR